MGWTLTESSPAHRSSPFGPDWTQNFDRINGLGLNGQIFGWTGRTGLLFEAATMDRRVGLIWVELRLDLVGLDGLLKNQMGLISPELHPPNLSCLLSRRQKVYSKSDSGPDNELNRTCRCLMVPSWGHGVILDMFCQYERHGALWVHR